MAGVGGLPGRSARPRPRSRRRRDLDHRSCTSSSSPGQRQIPAPGSLSRGRFSRKETEIRFSPSGTLTQVTEEVVKLRRASELRNSPTTYRVTSPKNTRGRIGASAREAYRHGEVRDGDDNCGERFEVAFRQAAETAQRREAFDLGDHGARRGEVDRRGAHRDIAVDLGQDAADADHDDRADQRVTAEADDRLAEPLAISCTTTPSMRAPGACAGTSVSRSRTRRRSAARRRCRP